jgi:hypothetical protein
MNRLPFESLCTITDALNTAFLAKEFTFEDYLRKMTMTLEEYGWTMDEYDDACMDACARDGFDA